MKELIFRGKRKVNGSWVHGFHTMYPSSIALPYSYTSGEHYLVTMPHRLEYHVDPETICQYKGFRDKNNQRVFDHDIGIYSNAEGEYGIGIIQDDSVTWIGGNMSKTHMITPLFYFRHGEDWEIIGNTFDNPELCAKTPENTDTDETDVANSAF